VEVAELRVSRGPAALAAHTAAPLVGAAGLLVVALAFGVVLSRYPPSVAVVFAVGLGLLGTLALALARYDAAVGLGLFLLAAVRFEPAPADLVLAVVIAVAAATNRFSLRRVPIVVTLLVGAFLALNMLSAIALVDLPRAVTFFGITFYLAVFGLWLAGYVQSVPRARVVLRAYVAGAVLSAAVASLALFVAFPGDELFVTGPRAQGLFKDPNVFGPFLVPAALLLL
jgi:predicted secreted protein